MNWNEFDKGVFLVNLLGIVYDPEKKLILIGKRENDSYIKELSWVFPGGRANSDGDLEDSIKNSVREKTGLGIEAKNVIFAKTYPEKREFLSIYYLCEKVDGTEKAGGSFSEIKWVKPTEVTNHFTTSLHPQLLEYLKTLE